MRSVSVPQFMRDQIQHVLPVLTYHSIDDTGSPISISLHEFRRHMQALSSAGWKTSTVSDAIAGLAAGGWPRRSFVLTFDDGYASVGDHAPVELAAHGFRPVLFVISGRVGLSNRWPGQPSWVPVAPLLDWASIRSLAQSGWMLGAHSRSHARLTALSAEEAEQEMIDSKAEIADRCGVAVNAFAYPYGAASPGIRAATGRHFMAAFGTRLANVTPRSHPTDLDRLDAYYLRGMPFIARLDGIVAASYFAARRAARAVLPYISRP